jgi:L-threonylcarbamoyladenylate synthase
MPLVSFDQACTLLKAGQPVAIPTETVYGLAALGLDSEAVARIFAIKGRPSSHPLILHLKPTDFSTLALPDPRAESLIEHFWPGPLTLVLRRTQAVPDAVTGGRETVALRAPKHPLAQKLIAELGPLAAPSANRFGQLSPTTAQHVLLGLPGVPVLEGGPCVIGVESSIVDLSGPTPALLRPGGISKEALETWLGSLDRLSSTPAPGTLPAHYAPQTRLIVSSHPAKAVAALQAKGLKVGILVAEAPELYAQKLYSELHRLDNMGVDVIVAEPALPVGIGIAVNDRLQRAAASFAG